MESDNYDQMLEVCRQAAKADVWGVLSTGEALAAALVLDKPEVLASMHYTIPEALARIGPTWAARIPEVAQIIEIETAAAAAKKTSAMKVG